jgi:hypothetical protein
MPFASSSAPTAKDVSVDVSDRRRARRFVTDNRASDRRYDTRRKLDLLVNRFLNGHPYMCRMIDISRTGARLVPILEPALREPPRYMGLQFQLPGGADILTASGEMMRARPEAGGAIGIRFSNLPPDSAWAIERYLAT